MQSFVRALFQISFVRLSRRRQIDIVEEENHARYHKEKKNNKRKTKNLPFGLKDMMELIFESMNNNETHAHDLFFLFITIHLSLNAW